MGLTTPVRAGVWILLIVYVLQPKGIGVVQAGVTIPIQLHRSVPGPHLWRWLWTPRHDDVWSPEGPELWFFQGRIVEWDGSPAQVLRWGCCQYKVTPFSCPCSQRDFMEGSCC